MRALRTSPVSVSILTLLILSLSPRDASAQVIGGNTLQGDWVRVDSNNDPNDWMRITVNVTAVLTSVPAAASPYWKAGDVLWQGIQNNGALRVRGSDGQYYDAMLTFNGPDEIHLDISMKTPGYDQTWRRAGPDISGDWVLVGPLGAPGAGTRINVQGTDATVGYLAASAPRVLRVGRTLWQQIGASGGLQALGSDNKYHAATWSLLAPDRIQVDATQIAGGPGQIWVRPASVAAVRASLQAAPAKPNSPGSNLTPPSNLPSSSIPGPLTRPPPGACSATALSDDAMGVPWGFGLTSSSSNPVQLETIGITKYWTPFSGTVRGQNELVDWEPALLPAFARGQAFVWQPRTRGWVERHDMTAAQFDLENQNQRSAGNRLSDFEAYDTSSGMRYAGTWVANTEGIAWSVDYDMTQAEYSTARQNVMSNGYRLVDIEGYETSSATRWGAVWYQSCDNTTWRDVLAMDGPTFDQQESAFARQGFRVVDLESYETSAGQRYAAIWEQQPTTRDWEVQRDLTIKGFINFHRRYEDDGYRLIDFESYDTSGGLRYAGIWAENDARHDFAIAPILDDSIRAYQAQWRIPGMSVVVIRNGEVIFRRGFGFADVANQKTASSQTIYLTASVAKVFGATIAARLEERGLLDLSSPTSDFVTLPSDHTHTIEQLLSKTGCVWHYGEGPAPTQQYYQWRDSAVAQMQAPLLQNPPPTPGTPPQGPIRYCTPGRYYHYSTHGFTFVGAALENVLQKDIHTIVYDEIARPYGLSSLRTVAPLVSIGSIGGSFVPRYDLAQGYAFGGSGSQTQNYEDSSWKVLGGGLQTDALDLARFGWLALNGDIVSPATRDTVLWTSLTGSATNWPSMTSAAPAVGLAWDLRNVAVGTPSPTNLLNTTTRRVAAHGGTATGARSQLTIFRDDGLVIAILTNQRNGPGVTDHPIQGLGDRIGRIVLRNPPPP